MIRRILIVTLTFFVLHPIWAEENTHDKKQAKPPAKTEDLKKENPILKLRNLLEILGYRTVAAPSKYSCRDYFNDARNFMNLQQAHPNYFDSRIEESATSNPRVLTLIKERNEFRDELREFVGTIVSLTGEDSKYSGIATKRGRDRFNALFKCVDKGEALPWFGPEHAYNAFCYNFNSAMSPKQKEYAVDLVSLMFNGSLACEPGADPECKRLIKLPFAKQSVPPKLLDGLAKYEAAEGDFHALFGGSEIKLYCVSQEMVGFKKFENSCPTEAKALAKGISANFAKYSKLITEEDFKIDSMSCKNHFKLLYGKLFSDPELKQSAVEIFEKYNLILQEGVGPNARKWNKDRISQLQACLKRVPGKFGSHLPLTSVVSYNIQGSSTNGWYWHSHHMLLLNGDRLNCKTVVHELGHAWDYNNEDPKDEWYKVGEFRKLEYQVPNAHKTSFMLSCRDNHVSGYARCSAGEDFAETLELATRAPWTVERIAPGKLKYLEKHVFGESINIDEQIEKIAKRSQEGDTAAIDALLTVGDRALAHYEKLLKPGNTKRVLEAMRDGGPKGRSRFLHSLIGNDERLNAAARELLHTGIFTNKHARRNLFKAVIEQWDQLDKDEQQKTLIEVQGIDFGSFLVEKLSTEDAAVATKILETLLPESYDALYALKNAETNSPKAAAILSKLVRDSKKSLKQLLASAAKIKQHAIKAKFSKLSGWNLGERVKHDIDDLIVMKDVEFIQELLHNSEIHKEVRTELAEALFALDKKLAKSTVFEMLKEPTLRATAIDALKIFKEDGLEPLEQVIRSEKNSDLLNKAIGSLALLRWETQKVHPIARKLINDPKIDTGIAVKVLEELYGYDEETLFTFVDHQKPKVGAKAVQLLKGEFISGVFEEGTQHFGDKNKHEALKEIFSTKKGLLYLAERFNPKPNELAHNLLVENAKEHTDVLSAIQRGRTDPKRPGIKSVAEAIEKTEQKKLSELIEPK